MQKITNKAVDRIVAFVYQMGDGDRWSGRLNAQAQRLLFGVYMGKGKIHIDLNEGTVEHVVKVCFGMDIDTTSKIDLRSLDVISYR